MNIFFFTLDTVDTKHFLVLPMPNRDLYSLSVREQVDNTTYRRSEIKRFIGILFTPADH